MGHAARPFCFSLTYIMGQRYRRPDVFEAESTPVENLSINFGMQIRKTTAEFNLFAVAGGRRDQAPLRAVRTRSREVFPKRLLR